MTFAFDVPTSRRSVWRAFVNVPSVLFAVIAGMLTALGYQLDTTGMVSYRDLLITSLVLTPLYLLAFGLVASWFGGCRHGKIESKSRPLLFGCVGVICLSWFVWYLVLFPGVYGYDGAFCLLEWIDDDAELTSRWSIPFTWLYSSVIVAGRNATGSYTTGFAVYSFLQMAFLIYCCARVIGAVMHRSKVAGPIATTLFFALNPLFPILAVSSSQDALFTGFFALIVVHVVELLDDTDAFRSSRIKLVLLAVVVLLFCLVRNNGLYALVVALPFLVLLTRGKAILKLIGCTFCIPMVVALLIQGPVYDAMGVSKTTTLQEMMSVPVMQLSRTYTYEGSSLSNQDKTEILSYIPLEGMQWYEASPELSDAMKAVLDVERIQSDPVAFVALYMRIGVAYPRDYFEAAALGSLGLWYPAKSYPDARMYHPYIESECFDARQYNPKYIDIPSMSFFPSLEAAVNELFGGSQNIESRGGEKFSSVPVLSLLLKSGTYFLATLAAVAFFIRNKMWNELAVLALFGGVGFTVLLGPVVLFRYIAPMMFAFPLVVSLLACPIGSKKHEYGRHARLRAASTKEDDL